jgi:ATP-binding protein involved in chromosome partitioning
MLSLMATLQDSQVRERLSRGHYPGFSRDIVSFGLVKSILIEEDTLTVQMALTTADLKVPRKIKAEAEAALEGLRKNVLVRIDVQAPAQPVGATGAPAMATTAIEGVRHIIAVASGKGAWAKACRRKFGRGLRRSGASVGLCDCDLYGPSIGLMFGTQERPFADSGDGRSSTGGTVWPSVNEYGFPSGGWRARRCCVGRWSPNTRNSF